MPAIRYTVSLLQMACNLTPNGVLHRYISFEHVQYHGLVHGQVGHEPLEPGILILELLEAPDLGHAHPGELLLPA
jgi:hypothetical protein